MAAHLSVSLSESMQASLIIQHQEERKKQQSTKGKSKSLDKVLSKDGSETSSKTIIPFYQQCLLVMVFAGIEMSATFMLIYAILFQEFLGVPTSLVSVEGIIAGGVSIIFLPITGYFADRGKDLVIRKMKMIILSVSVYLLGFSGLAICCVFNLDINKPIHDGNSSVLSRGSSYLYPITPDNLNDVTLSYLQLNKTHSTSIPIVNTDYISQINATTDISSNPVDGALENSVGPIQVIAILSCALLDMGFDTGMTLCRAFILEVSPPSIHTRLLIMATVFSSLGGLLFSSIGTIDFAAILGSVFKVDGTAVTVFMFCCGILTFIITTFTCTLVTGYSIYRKGQSLSETRQDTARPCDQSYDSESDFIESDRQSIGEVVKSNSGTKLTKGGNLGDDASEPLLTAQGVDNRSYSALSTTSAGELDSKQQYFYKNDIQQYQRILSPWEYSATNVIHEGKLLNTTTTNLPKLSDNKPEGHEESKDKDEDDDDQNLTKSTSDVESSTELSDDARLDDERGPNQEGASEISNLYAAMRASYSTSLSVVQTSILGDAHAQKSTSRVGLVNRQNSTSSEGPSIWKCKRLKFLLLSIFFTLGANLTTATYSGNTLSIGVYNGDPSAIPGTEERDDYNLGLRSVALGNLMMYSSFSIVCVLNEKIIDVIGEKSYFLASQMSYMIALIVFTLTKMAEIYFTLCVVSGFYRGCAFTLGYVMVNKLVKEETSKGGDKPVKNIGQIMALIGFLLPCKYVLLSSIVGPLMAALDSVWVPMVVAAVDSGLALCVFCIFLVVKG